MPTLYYSPNACSLSPHVALREAELPFTLEKVDFMRGKRLSDGRSLTDLSPKGAVPVLVLDDGQLLTEGVAIVQYIADQRPGSRLAPPPGSFARVRLQEWLNFIATELHKGFGPMAQKDAPESTRRAATETFRGHLRYAAVTLADRRYLMGDDFTVADSYMLYVLRIWQKFLHGDLPDRMGAYYRRLIERPAVRAALAAEGFDPAKE